MADLTREEAQKLVATIRARNGGISPEIRDRTPIEALEALENTRRQLGKQLLGLVDDLYSKDTRFAFELIQNAEDNQYNKAATDTAEPFLNFELHPGKIIIDSNEDGFRPENVEAICSARDSTKTSTEGYIGEKGIGFKALFKVASKVHIQSGPFSFSFEHHHGDDGMGLISPNNEEYREMPPDVRTRMTLTLSNSENLAKDFSNPLDNILLFLTKLKSITVAKYDTTRRLTTESFRYQYIQDSRRGTLTKILDKHDGLSAEPTVRSFHIARRTISNLPDDDHRTYQLAKQTVHINQAEIILAFPLDSSSVPLIQNQEVFAFLPLKDHGFKFMIQSDFIVLANRQDIIENEWNEALLNGVAQTFKEAVLQFCQHSTLQFQWMRYLPGTGIPGGFWAQLQPIIVEQLKETPILRPRSGRALKRPHQLKWLDADAQDKDGSPLFNDLPKELYLSQHYDLDDKLPLDQLGVQVVTTSEICARVRADLISPSSRMKSATSSYDWHSKSAKLLMRPFDNDEKAAADQIRKMGLIPLQDGGWASADSGSIFYPHSHDRLPIPTDLSLQLVSAGPLKHPDRKALLSKLGIKECPPEDVIAKIINQYAKGIDVNLQSSIMHLRYLYWELPKDKTSLIRFIYLLDRNCTAVYREFVTDGRKQVVDDMYFESDDEYGPKQLFSERIFGQNACPSYPAHFINSAYLTAEAPSARANDISWKDWLAKSANVHRIPRLARPSGTQLSEAFLHILKHRKDMIVGTLKHHWDSYSDMMTFEIVEALSKASVTCENVPNTPMKETYVPLPDLKLLCNKLGVGGKLPFLKLPVELPSKDWRFLEIFLVGTEADVTFYLHILQQIVRSNKDSNPELTAKCKNDLFTVYGAIEEHCKAGDRDRIYKFFGRESAVYVPPKGSRTWGLWAKPNDCVWNAPNFFDFLHPMAGADGYKNLGHLFRTILAVKDATYHDYISQIQSCKEKGESPIDILDIYRHIHLETAAEEDRDYGRQAFEEDSLIYVPSQQQWYSPSSCLWTNNTPISGKVAIASLYPGLQEFFVVRLGIQPPNVGMFIEELLRLANGAEASPIRQVRELIKKISSQNPTREALNPLRACNILPIKDTDRQVSLQHAASRFAIVDRLQYGDLFRGEVPVLDFGLEAIHELRPFLSALDLEDRYLSQIIKEVSMTNASTLDPILSRSMREKAYAIFRCAVHYGITQGQDQSLHRQFLATDVYRSSGITKTLTITLNGIDTTIEGATGNLHIEHDDLQIRLYVPNGAEDREFCYLSDIPETLVSHLEFSNPAAVKVIGDVVHASRSSVLDRLLEEHGIIRVSGIEPIPYPASGEQSFVASIKDTNITVARPMSKQQPRSSASSLVQNSNRPTLNHPSDSSSTTPIRDTNTSRFGRSASPRTPDRTESSISERFLSPSGHSISRSIVTPRSSVSPSPSRERGVPRLGRDAVDENYRILLNDVINAAARTRFPVFIPMGSATAAHANPTTLSENVFGRRSENQMSHDVKIGAAGELYAFEMLLEQSLPNFGRANWMSTVRKKVRVHDKYSDMPPWKGAETADIVYEDRSPEYKFTKLLVDNGHLPGNRLEPGPNLKYYLEVKSTTKECGTRFFVSKAQYQRMRRMALDPENPATDVYIILRVFNLGQDNIGMRLYVDPVTMKREGQLFFEPSSYIVTPGVEAEERVGPGQVEEERGEPEETEEEI